MHPKEVQKRLEHFATLCRQKGVPCTVQRQAVLEAVLASDEHPTADQVIEAVKRRVPNVSRTTVYRILEMLSAWGLIRRIHHPGSAGRFDGKTHRHHHLICMRCGKVWDVEDPRLDHLRLPEGQVHDFEVQDFSVHISGLCADCRRASPPA